MHKCTSFINETKNSSTLNLSINYKQTKETQIYIISLTKHETDDKTNEINYSLLLLFYQSSSLFITIITVIITVPSFFFKMIQIIKISSLI